MINLGSNSYIHNSIHSSYSPNERKFTNNHFSYTPDSYSSFQLNNAKQNFEKKDLLIQKVATHKVTFSSTMIFKDIFKDKNNLNNNTLLKNISNNNADTNLKLAEEATKTKISYTNADIDDHISTSKKIKNFNKKNENSNENFFKINNVISNEIIKEVKKDFKDIEEFSRQDNNNLRTLEISLNSPKSTKIIELPSIQENLEVSKSKKDILENKNLGSNSYEIENINYNFNISDMSSEYFEYLSNRLKKSQESCSQDFITFSNNLVVNTFKHEKTENLTDHSNSFTEIHKSIQDLPFIQNKDLKFDYYGFIIANEHLLHLYNQQFFEFQNKLLKIKKSWEIYLTSNREMIYTKELKSLIRKGIPKCYRARVWDHCLGSNILKKANPLYYKKLIETPLKESEASKQIELDLPRTFPNNIAFQGPFGINSLRRVLHAFALHKPEIGYCQALNYIAGILLLVFPEETAFWSLIQLIDSEIPNKGMNLSGYYCNGMESLLKDLYTLSILVKKRIPSVFKILQSYNINFEMICSDWLLCFFSIQLPTETVFRIWDLIVSEGSKILFRVALAIFYSVKEDLAQCRTMEKVMELLRKRIFYLVQHDSLINKALYKFKNFSHKELDEIRESYSTT